MEHSLDELALALAKAQGEIKPAPKDADNPYFKSKYSSLPAVREAMQEAFARHGLSVVQMPMVKDNQLQLRTVLLHESGQWLDCGTLAADVDLANPQKVGSAVTYFRRYALAAISQCVSDEDDDANAASQKTKPTKKEQVYITDALGEIAGAASLEDLNAIGQMFKDKAPVIQNALRGAFIARRRQLQEQQDAASDSQLQGDRPEPETEATEV